MKSLLEDFAAGLRFEKPPGVVEWVEQNLEFTPRVSPNMPGKVSTKLRPYMREPLENTRDSTITDEVYCWGAQTAKTTTAQLKLAYLMHWNPAPVLWVMPTEAMGRSWSDSRFHPFIESNPILAQHMPEDSDHWKILEMQFDRFNMAVVGSNSPAALASRPIAYLFCDEVCKFARASKHEASALALAKQRTKTFARAKRVQTSTPTIDKDEFWEDFILGDQRYYFMPCPHCGEHMVFEMKKETLVWDAEARDPKTKQWDLTRVAKSAHYVCPHCGGPVQDWNKARMLLAGDWQATNANALAGQRSYHLNSFYSPDVSFGQIAVEFLKAQSRFFGMQDFLNGWMALPFVEEGSEIDEKHIAGRRADYGIGRVPDGVEIHSIIAGVDYQQAFTNYVVRAFAANGASWLIDYGRVAGPDDFVEWACSARWEIGGKDRGIDAGLMDSGHQPELIYRVCATAAKRGLRLLPSKGTGERYMTTKPLRVADITIGGRTFKKSLVLYSDPDFKRMLYADCLRDGKRDWWIPEEIGNDYCEELLREKMVTVQNARGYEEQVWKRFGANHYADSEKLCLVMWTLGR